MKSLAPRAPVGDNWKARPGRHAGAPRGRHAAARRGQHPGAHSDQGLPCPGHRCAHHSQGKSPTRRRHPGRALPRVDGRASGNPPRSSCPQRLRSGPAHSELRLGRTPKRAKVERSWPRPSEGGKSGRPSELGVQIGAAPGHWAPAATRRAPRYRGLHRLVLLGSRHPVAPGEWLRELRLRRHQRRGWALRGSERSQIRPLDSAALQAHGSPVSWPRLAPDQGGRN